MQTFMYSWIVCAAAKLFGNFHLVFFQKTFRLNTTKKEELHTKLFFGIRRRPTLPGRVQPSTIGAEGLNFCVRYGNRWYPFAIATGNASRLLTLTTAHSKDFPLLPYSVFSSVYWISWSLWNQTLDLLVSSSYICYQTSTDDLSPDSPSGVLLPFRNGNLILEVSFTLRCFQRLSRPHFASLLCRWHDNSCTSGASIPVLSY